MAETGFQKVSKDADLNYEDIELDLDDIEMDEEDI